MKISLKLLCGIACVISISLAAIWNCGATALGLYIWFEPVPPGSMKLDAYDEIWFVSTILNGSIPIFLLGLAIGGVLAARRSIPLLAFIVASLLFLASLAPTLVFWQEIVRAHGPEINLWRNHIWWYIG
ncbi:MAG: hypothetical protein HY343_09390 [Lentisphaerae bacterium]|nr:hypothetical protein [Lentisphaerota bacterium]